MNKISTLKKEVVVVGAGAAGLTAAIAAARNGAEVLLVEYHGFVGGISATLAWLGFHDSVYRQVVKGLPMEFVTRLRQAGAASAFTLDPKCSSAVGIDIHYWKILAMQMLEEAGVELMLHTQVVDTLREGDRVTGIVVQHKSGCQDIRAEVVIDCSGDGDVAARAGAAWEKGRVGDGLVQAPTLVFRVGGIDRAGFIAGCKDPEIGYREWLLPYPDLWAKMMRRIDSEPLFITGGFAGLIEQARRKGDFDVPQSRIVGIKSHVPDEFIVVTTRVLGLDPTDVRSLTGAYARLYQQIPLIVKFFRQYMPGCAESYLREIAPMMGIRESRRIMGDYVLTREDVVGGRRFEDAVCMGGYHVDIHNPSGTWVHSFDVEAYTIPFRSLRARDVDGLLMAGKCLSATHEGVASTRVIPICMGQGQAVGTAAALAVRSAKSVHELKIGLLQDRLIAQGAELGQSLGEPDEDTIERIGVMPKSNHVVLPEQDQVSGLETAWVK